MTEPSQHPSISYHKNYPTRIESVCILCKYFTILVENLVYINLEKTFAVSEIRTAIPKLDHLRITYQQTAVYLTVHNS